MVTHFVNGTGQFADVSSLLDEVGIGSGNVASETTSTSFLVPGLVGTDVDLTFTFVRDTGAFQFSFGFFDLDAVTGIDPATNPIGWAHQAISNGVNVFDDRIVDPSATTTYSVQAGTELGFYLIPNRTVGDYLDRFPWTWPALFSESLANPGQRDQMLSFVTDGVALYSFEDLMRIGFSDEDFTDMAFTISSDDQLGANVVANPEPQTIIIWSFLGLSVAGVRFWRRRRQSK